MADIAAVNWNEVDASNTTAAPDGSPEGMAPSGVNNVLRAHQGAIKRWYNQTIPVTTAGTSAAFTVAYSVAPAALVDGDSYTVTFHVANSAGATLNVGLLGDKPLHYYSAGAWRLVPAALWGADQIRRVAYHDSSAAYRILDLPDRTGEIVAFAGATAPAGSLLCFGQAISRTDYVGLFTALGTAHGVGDGTSTFNLPDLRGRVAAGKGDMGGTESGRLNAQVASTLGAAGGAQTHALAAAENAAHGHGINDSGHAHTVTPAGGGTLVTVTGGNANLQEVPSVAGTMLYVAGATASSSGTGITIQSSGSGTGHNNVQPTMSLNYVIRI